MKIGVLDSGVGGLSILKYLMKSYPNNEYLYFGDNGNAPYGSKSREFITSRADFIFKFLISKEVDMIVVACNTIDSLYYDYYSKYKVPIYGIIRPFIENINKMNYENIGIIATTSTINSNLYQKSILKNVVAKATPDLVQIIEDNKILENIDLIKKNVIEFKNMDALILGCTHYELIQNEIKSILNIPLLFNGDAIVEFLKNKIIDSESSLHIYTTGNKNIYIKYVDLTYLISEVK